MLFQFEDRIYCRLYKLIRRGKIGTLEVRFDLFTPATIDILTEKTNNVWHDSGPRPCVQYAGSTTLSLPSSFRRLADEGKGSGKGREAMEKGRKEGKEGRKQKANSAFPPSGLVNEYQLRLGRKTLQVWFIPLADERGHCAGKTVKSLENACHTWAP